jgi:STE24 endopeptidase
MHPFTLLFAAFLAAGLALRLWLLGRQVRAVAAHRRQVPEPFADVVSAEQHAKAADYTIAVAKFSALQTVFDAALLLLLTIGGGIAWIDALVAESGAAGMPHGIVVIGTVALGLVILGLPLAIWRTFRIEARFGFNRTTPVLFAADHLKGLVISLVLFGPLVALLLWLAGRAGDTWWLWAWTAWAAFSVVISWAWPRFIAPLFNRFRELPEGALRAAVIELAHRCGFEPRGVFVMDGSRRSTHGNAYFTGLGRHKRIVFFDTLLEALAIEEVQAVLAHELGHFRLRHVAWRIALSLVASFVGFALLAWLAGRPWFQPALGVANGGFHTLFLLFALAVPVFLLPVGPLAAWLSRRHEYAADAFAARHADAAALARALVKLHRDNATTLTPDRLYTAFHASHPPPLDRIGRLTAQHST